MLPLRLKKAPESLLAFRGFLYPTISAPAPRLRLPTLRLRLPAAAGYWLRCAPPYRLDAAAIRQFPSAQPLNPTQKGIRAAPSHRCSRRSGQGYINGVAALAAASVCPAIVAPLMALMGGADTPGRTMRAPSHRRPSPPISCVRSAAPGPSRAGGGGPAKPLPAPVGAAAPCRRRLPPRLCRDPGDAPGAPNARTRATLYICNLYPPNLLHHLLGR